MIHLSIHHRNCRQVTTTTDSLLMSRSHETLFWKHCYRIHFERGCHREQIESIHPSIQQPNMKPSQLCLSFMVFFNHLSPLRTRFTFCLNLPDPKVSKMEDLACSFFPSFGSHLLESACMSILQHYHAGMHTPNWKSFASNDSPNTYLNRKDSSSKSRKDAIASPTSVEFV